MKPALWIGIVGLLGACSSSDPAQTAPTDTAPLCDAEKAWLARCPSADDCARLAVTACKRVTSQTSSAYQSVAIDAFGSAPCNGFDAAQFAKVPASPTAEQTKAAQAFCNECRPGVGDCVARFFAGEDLATGTSQLVLTMSEDNAHELNNRWPTMADAGSCETTFKQVVTQLFTERVSIAHCP